MYKNGKSIRRKRSDVKVKKVQEIETSVDNLSNLIHTRIFFFDFKSKSDWMYSSNVNKLEFKQSKFQEKSLFVKTRF